MFDKAHGAVFHLAGEEIHLGRADEAGDEEIVGIVVKLEWRADLFDHTVAQDDDAVGQRHRFDLIVGDVDHRGVEFAMQPRQLDTHVYAQLGIEIGKRLVEQEDLRVR